MIFLFEEHYYSSKFLKKAIGHSEGDLKYRSKSGFNTETTKNGVKINGVGYCFYNGQPVFVLPKVFLDENGKRAFGENIDFEGKDCFGNQKEESQNFSGIRRKFFSSISLWLYSAIDKYNKNSDSNKDNGVETPPQSESRNFKKNDRYSTLLDIMSSMELFYKKNQSLFVFVAKNKHSGNHKINWQRTVNKTTPFIQNGVPIYMNPVNKVKVFDLDDRLLVLYFSAMKYIQDKFGYQMPQSEFYKPLKMSEIERLLGNERGLRELKRIKYKYFEDRLVKLYNIIDAFFRWGAIYKSKNNNIQEYLIANSFNNVFEAMIDELIGDPEFEKLKNNDDGKIIDHLYKEKSLIFSSNPNDNIWHIGDSKYYQDPEDIRGKAIYKQFTYAKNLIQNFFSPKYFKNGETHTTGAHRDIRYRDDLTEGYSVTPNFFIRGELPKFDNNGQYRDPYFCKDDSERERLIAEVGSNETFDDGEGNSHKNINDHLWENRNRHFKNRLFDRDTLLLQVYNVNFLYVLKAYTSKHSGLRDEFKTEARKKFRENFFTLLNSKYYFWMISSANLNDIIDRNFKQLTGRIFKPLNFKNSAILALEKDIVDKSKEGTDDDYQKIRKIIDDAKCEIFNVHPKEILDYDNIDKISGWNININDNSQN